MERFGDGGCGRRVKDRCAEGGRRAVTYRTHLKDGRKAAHTTCAPQGKRPCRDTTHGPCGGYPGKVIEGICVQKCLRFIKCMYHNVRLLYMHSQSTAMIPGRARPERFHRVRFTRYRKLYLIKHIQCILMSARTAGWRVQDTYQAKADRIGLYGQERRQSPLLKRLTTRRR
ncbi:hypothetical protein PENSPDRAFT_288590 [Peniophora sp. CONT]|nr:hypothetical protein PENSPDRAFT_288590 [Peniophora sp. CONT]